MSGDKLNRSALVPLRDAHIITGMQPSTVYAWAANGDIRVIIRDHIQHTTVGDLMEAVDRKKPGRTRRLPRL